MADEINNPRSRTYWCFLSYRHADNREEGRQWATWLHHEIETYEVPADLIGTQNERGETISERIFPVFRDEDELPANADLGTPIYGALEASSVLLVLCSPRAVTSTYVGDEIRYFKKIGKANRVLVAMLEGEPNASWDAGKQSLGHTLAEECFPEALRHPVDANGELIRTEHAEPIAADFRLPGSTAQGWTSPEAYRRALVAEGGHTASQIETAVSTYRKRCELAKLKIIAGILGLPLGQLTRRDAAYQLELARKRSRILRRWLAAVTVFALLAITGGVIAWHQRQKAVEARRAADELISYMQYDLSDLLRKIGKLNLMDSVNERIRQYHTAHPAETGDSQGLREKSVSLDQKGDLLRDEGKQEEALAIYREALAIDRRLADEQPNNLARLDDLAISHERIGDMERVLGDHAEALKSYRASLAIRERLVHERHLSAYIQSSLALVHERIGNVLHDQGELPAAMDSFRQSQRIRELAAKAEPDNLVYQRNVSVVSQLIGDTLRELGKPAEALDEYERCQKIAEQMLEKEPENNDWKRDLAMARQREGDVHKVQGAGEQALQDYRESLDLSREIAKHDPQNSLWQRDLAIGWEHVGDALYDRGSLAEALDAYRAALAVEEAQSKFTPQDTNWQRDLSVTHNQIGQILRLQQHLPEALEHVRAAHDLSAALAARDPQNAVWQRDLSVSDNKVGDILRAQKQSAEAEKYYQDGLAIMKKLTGLDPSNTGWQRDLALSHSKVATTLDDQGKPAEALAECRADLAIVQRLLKLDPDNSLWQGDVAMSHERIGLLAQRQKDWATSNEAFEHDLEIIRPKIGQPHPDATWVGMFATATVSRAQILLMAPPGSVAIDRAAARADLDTARAAFAQLEQEGRLLPSMTRSRTILDAVIAVMTPGAEAK